MNHIKAFGEEKIYEILQELLWNYPSQVFFVYFLFFLNLSTGHIG